MSSATARKDALTEEEAAFVARARRGDREAFAPLVERHRGRLVRLCARLLGKADAEDAVQEAFLKAWNALHLYDLARPFASWIGEIAVNVCRDRQRGAWWRRVLLDDEVEELLAQEEAADLDFARNESMKALVAALDQLRPQDRQALAPLADERPVAEAASELGISSNALYVRQTRARARLAELLRRERPDLFEGDE